MWHGARMEEDSDWWKERRPSLDDIRSALNDYSIQQKEKVVTLSLAALRFEGNHVDWKNYTKEEVCAFADALKSIDAWAKALDKDSLEPDLQWIVARLGVFNESMSSLVATEAK